MSSLRALLIISANASFIRKCIWGHLDLDGGWGICFILPYCTIFIFTNSDLFGGGVCGGWWGLLFTPMNIKQCCYVQGLNCLPRSCERLPELQLSFLASLTFIFNSGNCCKTVKTTAYCVNIG